MLKVGGRLTKILGIPSGLDTGPPPNKDMVSGRLFRKILDKFIKSPVGGDARVQVVLPNGEFYDITGAKMMQNKLIGVRESHRIVLTVMPERARMGKILRRL